MLCRGWLASLLILSFVSIGSSHLLADTPDDPEQAILELHKSGKLFDKARYKTVRAAFARLFEKKHDAEIHQAYGSDYADFTSWLDAHAEIKQNFYTALNEKFDKLPAALSLFKDIWKKSPEQLEKYPNLAIAVAVTWDDARSLYDYRGHQTRTKSLMPDNMVDALGNFKYIIDHEKIMQGRLRYLPWEFLVFVVDHRTPLDERDWARQYFQKTRGVLKSWHQDVPYDMDMLRGEQLPGSSLKPHLAGKPYTLSNIRKEGGVCAQQADFAARVGKSVGVPAVYCWGRSSYRGLHAWWMYVQVQSASNQQIRCTLVSDGRIQGFLKDQLFTGNVIDPQTGQRMLDRDLEHQLALVGRDAIAKRQADLVMHTYPSLSQRLELDVKGRVAYLDQCLKLQPSSKAAWLEFARLCREKNLDAKQKNIVQQHLQSLTRTFANHPDFVAQLVDDLLTVQPDANEKIRLYESVAGLFEKKGRADLACAARLKIADMWCNREKWQTAGKGLMATVRKFPNEGRFIPQMTKKLQDVVGHYQEGPPALAKLYVELVPTMIVYYGKGGSDYCGKLSDQAVAFLEEKKLDRQAATLKAKMAQARQKAGQP